MSILDGSGSVPPPPPTDVFGRVVATGLYFNGNTLYLDGYKFQRCRFDNCVLTVNTANFELVHCVIDQTCTLVWGQDAAKSIRLFNRFVNPEYAAKYPFFCPIFHNEEGSISINAYQ